MTMATRTPKAFLPSLGKDPGMRPQSVACRGCGGRTWIWVHTVGILMDTGGRPSASVDRPSRQEFRCATCNRKATMEESGRIKSTRAYKIANGLGNRDSSVSRPDSNNQKDNEHASLNAREDSTVASEG